MGKQDTIKIFLRIRPDADGGKFNSGRCSYDVNHGFDSSTVKFHIDKSKDDDYVNHAVEDYSYKFSRVFEPQSSQEEVFNTVAKDCVLSAMDGYNSTLFAYGQTGSGKTFSITGGADAYEQRGIIPRALDLVYQEVKKRTDYNWTVRLSYMQIYNDNGQDLFNRGNDAAKLEDLPQVSIHETDDEVVLKGLEAHTCSSTHEALELLFLGDTNRIYCETPMNKTSSRSHCIFTVSLEAREHGSAIVRRSKLNLVDLAGSERVHKSGASGSVLNEARFINSSLHFLETVITALAEQSKGRRDHIPYRNSILTRVLRDSLGGNCRTVMLAAGHPADRFLMETVATCRFAQRVASIKQSAEINEETDPHILVKRLRAEIAALKERIKFLEQGSNSAGDRELSADELERCRDAVKRFVATTDSKSTIEGVGGDYSRILVCFQIMKEMIKNGGGGSSDSTAARPGSVSSTSGGGGTVDGPGSIELQRKVKALEVSLQQKENEVSILLAIVEKNRANAASGGQSSQVGGPTGSIIPPSQPSSSIMAAGPSDRPPGWTGSGGSSSATTTAPAPAAGALGDTRTRAQQLVAQEQASMQTEALRQDYNLDALSDPELLKNREEAFAAFRKSYRKIETIEKSKQDMRERIERVKALAGDITAYKGEVKNLKDRVMMIRQQRVLQDGTDEPDAEESQMMERLKKAKEAMNARAADMEKERTKIDTMNGMMKKAQDQLIKDFESWFSVRQQQIVKAGGGVNIHQQPGSSSGGRPPPSTPPQQQQSSIVNQSVFAAGSARPAVQQLQPSTPPDYGPRTSSGGAFTAQQQARVRQEHDSMAAQVPRQPNPYHPQQPSTGNTAADAELARLFQARERMKQQLAGNGQ